VPFPRWRHVARRHDASVVVARLPTRSSASAASVWSAGCRRAGVARATAGRAHLGAQSRVSVRTERHVDLVEADDHIARLVAGGLLAEGVQPEQGPGPYSR